MRKQGKKESGEIMIESTIAMVIVMLMLVWILGIGFIYYQKYTVRIATNDIANRLALTYDAPTSDPITAYVSKTDIKKKNVYITPDATEVNQLRADSYVTYIIKKANLYGTVEDVEVEVAFEEDGLGRSHIAVTTDCVFNTPFGEALELFGMSGDTHYRVTSYADSTSISEYVSAVLTADAISSGAIISAGGLVDSVIGMVESIAGMCNQLSK